MTTVERGTESLGVLHRVGTLATTVTAVMHLRLGVRLVPSQPGISFLSAGPASSARSASS